MEYDHYERAKLSDAQNNEKRLHDGEMLTRIYALCDTALTVHGGSLQSISNPVGPADYQLGSSGVVHVGQGSGILCTYL